MANREFCKPAEFIIAELFAKLARLKVEGVEKSMVATAQARLRFRFFDQLGTKTRTFPGLLTPTPL